MSSHSESSIATVITAVQDTEVFQARVAAHAHLQVAGNTPPWQGTGLKLEAGQHYSVFASGRIQWSRRHPDLHGGPRFHLWARVAPGGAIVNLRQDTDSFIADHSGELELGIYMGMWQNDRGDLASDLAAYARLEGALEVSLLVWRGTASGGLAALLAAGADHAALSAELKHLEHPQTPPPGWSYLVEAGQAEIYRQAETDKDQPCIHLTGADEQGIIVREVDFPLTPDTRLSWRWRVDQHPSEVPEDTPYTHDYVSVAAEFEDGRDLTWIWSSSLLPGHHFACPIKAWSARETHFVVRSGAEQFGQWVEESRPVYADVAAAIGPPPARIVRIWLIVVATFQHGSFDASVAEITLHDGAQRLQVL